MAYVANRRCRINGVDYQAGDAVPTEGLRNLRSLVAARYLVAAPDAPATEPPAVPALTDMTRAELNALAAERGIAAPEKLPNKAAVVAAIEVAGDEPADSSDGSGDASTDNDTDDSTE